VLIIKYFTKTNSLLLIIALTLLTCGKPKPEVKHLFVSEFAKSYVAFKPGSYWIYRNDSSSITDSVYVQQLTYRYENETNNDGDIISTNQRIWCQLISNIIINSDNGFSTSHIYLGDYSISHWGIDLNFKNDVVNPILTTDTCFSYQTMILNGQLFNNVTEQIQHSTNSLSSEYRVDVYLVKNIGLIKWNVNYRDGSTEQWSLLRYNIIM
jgi:hypothetical protein